MADPRFNILGYLNPFNRKKGVKALAWLASRYLGAHELNVSQEILRDAIGRIGTASLGEGAVVSGGIAIKGEVSQGNVTFKMGEADIFLLGSIHDIDATAVTLPATGTHAIGIRLASITLDHNADATLKGIAPGTRAEGEAMAHAYIQLGAWGWEGDDQEGEFFPIYTVIDGDLVKEAAGPQNDAYTNQLRLYDWHAHGHYIVEGYITMPLGLKNGKQVFSISEGTINVQGYKNMRLTSARKEIDEEPDIEAIQNEPHSLTGAAPYVIKLRYAPLLIEEGHPPTVIVTRQKQASMVHGAYSGIADSLPDATVFKVVSVKRGTTSYTEGTDFLLSGAAIDWRLPGEEPSPGDSYQVVYQYTATVPPDAVTATTVTINDGVSNSVAMISYRYKMPRYDAFAVDRDGVISYVKGVSSRLSPQKAYVGGARMKIADVWNIWGDVPVVKSTATKRVSVEEERSVIDRLSNVEILTAELRLQNDISSREPVSKRGIFSDPLIDDTFRDQGTPQTAAVFGGKLVLPISATAIYMPVPERTLPYTEEVIIEQAFITETMRINPYQAFPAPVPAASLDPATDIWSETETIWTSDVTRRFYELVSYYWDPLPGSGPAGHGYSKTTATAWSAERMGTKTTAIEFIRQRDVGFTLTNFGPGETLTEVLFDGVPVSL